ncbi:response regulator transcription factor [Candidatus Saccharibacteria bacterium]|jgi:DNA-binding response OmpR family regulator|nr:MAG: response regulator transcription factor [Candidatus Saccharibacteria bacterium]
MKILVIEDEHRIANALKEGLEQESYAVDVAYDGEQGYLSASADNYDIILLDVMLPIMDGYTVCKKLRAEGNHTPVLMLTARDQVGDIVHGLDNGADDYLPKPFSFDVLLARIRALMRRPNDSIGEVFKVADLKLDPNARRVERAGKEIRLSSKEYAILEYLMRNNNKVLSKDQIIAHVWDFDSDILPNNVEVFINYLRRKIDKPFKKQLLHTIRGFGYRLSE